ncbi:putative anaerobic sulfatase-maturating enzyme [Anaerohalosphaera lusitana]|uniref:Putative anaerobic sulfatase-maturating enzyme n=1 Tax=Anaerohalosphaera lusitana TaxID=1936003 RepID=A0A1U9NMM2_9BACT|nr:anaerobic sulfatase maturase [Anaerohalosphaera lusitana]AQT68978.1 putative anaerobic sulfatase-maturating enzyme [Anaerohalosphaera lusitana]
MRPFSLLIKPTGPDCNIDCRYCFYTCKTTLFGGGRHRMSEEVLEKMVNDFLGCGFPQNSFAWQGGEPTLMGLDFYKKVVELQEKACGAGQNFTNSLQTNGILLDDEWCEFLAEKGFLVGISIDGPKKFHDKYRLDHGGNGTFDRVMAAIERCKKHGVQFNILTLLNSYNVEHPDELFDFYVENGFKFLQFIQCVEEDPETGEIADFSITPEQYGDFLCRIFDRWVDHGVRKMSIRTFDSMISQCLGMGATECTFMPKCADYVVVEHDGGVYCCDFFVENEHRIGNLLDRNLGELAGDSIKRRFNRQKRKLANKCLVCRHLDICRGGCPKDRKKGYDDGITYFCEGYKKFFDHSMGEFWKLASMIQQENLLAERQEVWNKG